MTEALAKYEKAQPLFDAPTETRMGKHAIVLECDQGSGQWFGARLGIATASRFSDIITPTGKPTTGQKRDQYINEMVGEKITGCVQEHFTTAAMEQGKAREPRARGWYEMETGKSVRQVGFVLHDSRRYGCSPDGLVGEDSGLEIKCPLRQTFIKHMRDPKPVPSDYIVQMQASMWICERPQWDFVLYSEDKNLRPMIQTVLADYELHKVFADMLPVFCDEVAAAEKSVRERMAQ